MQVTTRLPKFANRFSFNKNGVPVIFFFESYVTDRNTFAFKCCIILFTMYYCITVLLITLSENKIMILISLLILFT